MTKINDTGGQNKNIFHIFACKTLCVILENGMLRFNDMVRCKHNDTPVQ